MHEATSMIKAQKQTTEGLALGAEDLARKHRTKLAASGSLPSEELADLEADLNREFRFARMRVEESQREEFANVYNTIRNSEPVSPPPPPPPVTSDATQKVVCPACRSSQITASKSGFGLGKAVVGGVLLGGVGLLGGFVGSRKILVTCLKCGHSWKAGKQ
jgi:tellurium resistance protein TerD